MRLPIGGTALKNAEHLSSYSLIAVQRRVLPTLGHSTFSCRSSSSRAEDYSLLQAQLLARKLPPTYDYLNPVPSHLLHVALSDFLPPPKSNIESENAVRILPTTSSAGSLPQTHHLVYFPPPIPPRDLLSDGTDPLQSPGPPFVRRMWAGGSVLFHNRVSHTLLPLDGRRTACLESIRDVSVKGQPGSEKVFVGIERRVGPCAAEDEPESVTRQRLWRETDNDFGDSVGIIERRNIVFMRERSREQAVQDMEVARRKQMTSPRKAEGLPVDWEWTCVPDAKLLFRYSALTYNAHRIHLDPEYSREVEGHRGMLVHGPLGFTFLVTLLKRHLEQDGKKETVKTIEYRNLTPLYCHEPIKFCGRRARACTDGVEEGKWDIWAETPEGGVAVKGVARTELL